jgi:TfoX/Sxy family transcriptional regulator of competence genes
MEAKARYDEIADELVAENADVELGQMMGMPCIKAGGKMIAGIWQEEMVFKLPDEAVREQALALEGAHLFDPSEEGRAFREWVQVPAAHMDEWPRLADESIRLRAG